MTDALGVDYEETVEPFLSAKRDFDSIKEDLTKTVTTFGQAATIPEGTEVSDAPKQDSAEAAASAEPDATGQEPGVAAGGPEAATPADGESPDDSTAAT